MKSRIRRAARWLAPSAAAACGGAIAAGALEGAGMDSLFGGAAAAGFVALVALPGLFVASALIRGVWRAWQPEQLGLLDDGGGAPRLAGWLGVVVLGCAALAWMMFQGTWVLAGETAFKPLGVSFAEPVFAVASLLAAIALSRPVARLLSSLIRRADARWRARGHRSIVTPRKIVIALAIKLAVLGALFWHFVVRRRFGPFDLTVLETPVAGIAAAVAVHLAWSRVPARVRRIGGALLGAAGLGLVALALIVWRAQPSLALSIWGERPIAGLAIDRLFDVDAIRQDVSLAEFRPVPRPGAPHPDIMLVTIESVRADHTPPYGGTAEMPVLRELGIRGAVFDYAFAPSSVTGLSLPSMMIGLAPNRVKGRVVRSALRVDPRHVMLAERLEAGGYDTAGFICCEGFWGTTFDTGLQRGLQHLEIASTGPALAQRARAWLDERATHRTGRPLFLWMHVLEPGDRSLPASDAVLAELLAAFSQRPPAQAPIIIVTADRGEPAGEHGQPDRGPDLYDAEIQVPLVMAGPPIRTGHVPETVSLTGLVPTVLELAGFVPPKGPAIDGASFADLATGARNANPDAGTAYAATLEDRHMSAMIRGRFKLIDNGIGLEMYDIHTDPHEHANLLPSHPPAEAALRKLMRAHNDAADRSPFD